MEELGEFNLRCAYAGDGKRRVFLLAIRSMKMGVEHNVGWAENMSKQFLGDTTHWNNEFFLMILFM